MSILNQIKNIVKVVDGINTDRFRVAYEANKTTEEMGTYIHADNMQSILFGKVKEDWTDVVPEIGIQNLPILKAALNAPQHQSDQTTASWFTETDNDGNLVPTELHINDGLGNDWKHRFMDKLSIEKNFRPLYPKPMTPQVLFKVTDDAIEQAHFSAKALADFAKVVEFKLVDGKVILDIGGRRGQHRTQVEFAPADAVHIMQREDGTPFEMEPFGIMTSSFLDSMKLVGDFEDRTFEIHVIEKEDGRKRAMLIIHFDDGLIEWQQILIKSNVA